MLVIFIVTIQCKKNQGVGEITKLNTLIQMLFLVKFSGINEGCVLLK